MQVPRSISRRRGPRSRTRASRSSPPRTPTRSTLAQLNQAMGLPSERDYELDRHRDGARSPARTAPSALVERALRRGPSSRRTRAAAARPGAHRGVVQGRLLPGAVGHRRASPTVGIGRSRPGAELVRGADAELGPPAGRAHDAGRCTRRTATLAALARAGRRRAAPGARRRRAGAARRARGQGDASAAPRRRSRTRASSCAWPRGATSGAGQHHRARRRAGRVHQRRGAGGRRAISLASARAQLLTALGQPMSRIGTTGAGAGAPIARAVDASVVRGARAPARRGRAASAPTPGGESAHAAGARRPAGGGADRPVPGAARARGDARRAHLRSRGSARVTAYRRSPCARRSTAGSTGALPEGQTVKKGDLLAQIDPRPFADPAAPGRGARSRATRRSCTDAQAQPRALRRRSRKQNLIAAAAGRRSARRWSSSSTAPCRPTRRRSRTRSCSSTTRASPRRSTASPACAWSTRATSCTPPTPTGIVVVTQLDPIAVIFTLPQDDLPRVADGAGARATSPVEALEPRRRASKLGDGQARADRQPDQPDDRDDPAQGDLPQPGARALAEPVRQGAAAPRRRARTRSSCRPRRSSAGRRARSSTSSTPTSKAAVRPDRGRRDRGRPGDRRARASTPASRSSSRGRTSCGPARKVVAAHADAARRRRRGAPGGAARAGGGARTAARPRSAAVSISEPFIRRPVATTLLMVGLLLAGIVGYRAAAGRGAAAGRLPDDRRLDAAARRERRDDGLGGDDAARAPVRADAVARADDVGVELRQLADHAAVHARSQHRRRRAGRAGGDQRRVEPAAAHAAGAADLQQEQPRRHADPHARGQLATRCRSTQVDDYADSILAQKISQVSGVGLVTLERRAEAGGARAGRSRARSPAPGSTLEDVRTALVAANVNQPKGNLDGPRQDYTHRHQRSALQGRRASSR